MQISVIPNPRILRVRDLLFASTHGKKQIPHSDKKQGFGMTVWGIFRNRIP
jgi:hypothetical protein